MSRTGMKRRELGCAKLNAKPQWRGSSEMSVVGRDWRMDGSDDSSGCPFVEDSVQDFGRGFTSL